MPTSNASAGLPVKALLIVGFLTLAALGAGCGQKGPLYIPGDPEAVEAAENAVDQDMSENGEETTY